VTAASDTLNGFFNLSLDLRGLDAPKRMTLERDLDGNVHANVFLSSPRQVFKWAKQMGVPVVTGEPTQAGGETWWYRTTKAVLERRGLRVVVASTQMALDRDACSMTEPVTA